MTLATAEMQFSVALTFSLALESADWITPTSSGTASERTMTTCMTPYDVHDTENMDRIQSQMELTVKKGMSWNLAIFF